MKAITLFNEKEGYFTFENLIEVCAPMIRWAKEDKEYLHFWNTSKWYLAELYCALKKQGHIPKLSLEDKKRIWREAGHDKQLAFSLYLIEII